MRGGNRRRTEYVFAVVMLAWAAQAQEKWQDVHDAGNKAAAELHFAEADTLLTRALTLARNEKNIIGAVERNLLDLGEVQRTEGKYGEAQASYEEALPLAEKDYGPGSIEVAEALDHSAELAKTLNDFAHGEQLLQRAMEIVQKKELADDDPVSARIKNDLGELYTQAGTPEKAEPLLRSALDARQKKNPASRETAESLEALGNLLRRIGKESEAEPLFRQSVSLYGKVLGGEHPDYANALESLALFYVNRRQYDLAGPLLQRVLEIREKVLGPEHHDVAVVLDNLGLLEFTANHFAKAATFYRRALRISEKLYGADSPFLATDLNNIASSLQFTTGRVEAEPYFERALALDDKALGPEHPDVAMDLFNLGSYYALLNRPTEAIPFLERALTIQTKVLGNDALEVNRTMITYAQALRLANRETEARVWERKAAEWEKAHVRKGAN